MKLLSLLTRSRGGRGASARQLAIKAPPAATTIASEEAQLKEIAELQTAVKAAGTALGAKKERFEESVRTETISRSVPQSVVEPNTLWAKPFPVFVATSLLFGCSLRVFVLRSLSSSSSWARWVFRIVFDVPAA